MHEKQKAPPKSKASQRMASGAHNANVGLALLVYARRQTSDGCV